MFLQIECDANHRGVVDFETFVYRLVASLQQRVASSVRWKLRGHCLETAGRRIFSSIGHLRNNSMIHELQLRLLTLEARYFFLRETGTVP